MNMAELRKGLLVVAGLISVGLGTAGVFLPLLPTTPFLLLAAACFIRSSERLYNWLIRHKWFGSYIRNYREHRAVALRVKVSTLVLLWATIGYSAIVVVSNSWIRVLLAGIAIGVTIHVLRLKTLTQDMLKRISQEDAKIVEREAVDARGLGGGRNG